MFLFRGFVCVVGGGGGLGQPIMQVLVYCYIYILRQTLL